MCVTYLTGTRHPGEALLKFLPGYIDTLLGQGAQLITSNKKGVDEAVFNHCEVHHLPLKVCVFLHDHNFYMNRHVTTTQSISLQKIYSPTWLRFRHLADQTERMIFLHAAKTRGACQSVPTVDAFAQACQQRQIPSEQLIVQRQSRTWVNVTELRTAPVIGTAHLYIYARLVYGLARERHAIGYYRLETWRGLQGVVQPGIGRRELILPHFRTPQATLEMLSLALLELQSTPPPRLVIHYCLPSLPQLKRSEMLCQLVSSIPQVIWEYELKTTLLPHIGTPIRVQSELWYHERMEDSYRGLYQ